MHPSEDTRQARTIMNTHEQARNQGPTNLEELAENSQSESARLKTCPVRKQPLKVKIPVKQFATDENARSGDVYAY
eukprot:3002048-Rhodomonas_salina.1